MHGFLLVLQAVAYPSFTQYSFLRFRDSHGADMGACREVVSL